MVISALSQCDCRKEKKETINASDYFTISDAEFVSSNFPATSLSGPILTSVSGNKIIIPGGAYPITVVSTSTISYVIVGIKDISGYFKIAASRINDSSYLATLIFPQEFLSPSFTVSIAVLDENGKASQAQYIDVASIAVGTGKLQVSLTWDKLNDLDLHLVEPGTDGTESIMLLLFQKLAGCLTLIQIQDA